MASLINKTLVTAFYVEGSTIDSPIYVEPKSTLGSVRQQVQEKVREKVQKEWGYERSPTHPEIESIILTSSNRGSDDFKNNSVLVKDRCTPSDKIYAIVPSHQSSSIYPAQIAAMTPTELTSPLRDMKSGEQVLLDKIKEESSRTKAERERERKKFKDERRTEREQHAKAQGALAQQQQELEQETAKLKEQRVVSEEMEKLTASGVLQRLMQLEQTCNGYSQRFSEQSQLINEQSERIEKLEQENQAKSQLISEQSKRIGQLEQDNQAKSHLISEQWQRIKVLQQRVVELEAICQDTSGWIAAQGQGALLDKIKLRHLLNTAQMLLGLRAGLTTDRYLASLSWRNSFGNSLTLQERVEHAHSLLHAEHVLLDEPTKELMTSSEALRLVVESPSRIREQGDEVAHPARFTREVIVGAIERDAVESVGLKALMDFVLASSTPNS